MVYTDDDEYAKHRGYDDFAAFANSETIPSDAGLEEIRKRANAIVNVAYHGTEEDATEFTTLLGEYELLVMDRIVQHTHKMDNLEDTPGVFLQKEEIEYLKGLSGDRIHSVSMYNTENAFNRRVLF